MSAFDQVVAGLLDRLLWTSLQAAVLVGVVALIVRLLPRLPASARCALWWLVGLQVIVGLGWQSPLRLPLLAPKPVVAATAVANRQPAPTSTPVVVLRSAPSAVVDGWSPLAWREALAALWLLGLLVQTRGAISDRRRMRRCLRNASAPADSLQQQCNELARRIGLRRSPRLRVSSAVASPLVTGFWRPVIVWPAAPTLTSEETSLALAHELAHVQRGDLWLGCVPVVAQRLLFFHPLLRWALREYAAHREATCDARAMQALDAAPQCYGRLLLRLGVADFGPATLASASSTFRDLKRRLSMLQSAGTPASRVRAWLLVAGIAAIGLVPYRVGAAVGPDTVRSLTLDRHAPPTKCVVTANTVGADGVSFCGARFLSYSNPHDAQGSTVLFDDGAVIIEGYHPDVIAAKRYYRPGEDLLWFRRDGKTYVVRDPAILANVAHAITPIIDHYQDGVAVSGNLDKMNLRLAGFNRELNRLNRELNALNRQQATRVRQGATISPDSLAATRAKIKAVDASIAAEQAKIQALQRSVDAQQAALQRWQRNASDGIGTLSVVLAQLVDAAQAKGVAREVDL